MGHGLAAGVCAGLLLGFVQMAISVWQGQSIWWPFRVATALVFGPGVLRAEATISVVTVGTAMHLGLAAVFGVVFLALLAVTYQLSARRGMLVGYGLVYGLLLWETNFMAVLPAVSPDLVPHLGLTEQLWRGTFAHTLAFGFALAGYVAMWRPGVVADWRR